MSDLLTISCLGLEITDIAESYREETAPTYGKYNRHLRNRVRAISGVDITHRLVITLQAPVVINGVRGYLSRVVETGGYALQGGPSPFAPALVSLQDLRTPLWDLRFPRLYNALLDKNWRARGIIMDSWQSQTDEPGVIEPTTIERTYYNTLHFSTDRANNIIEIEAPELLTPADVFDFKFIRPDFQTELTRNSSGVYTVNVRSDDAFQATWRRIEEDEQLETDASNAPLQFSETLSSRNAVQTTTRSRAGVCIAEYSVRGKHATITAPESNAIRIIPELYGIWETEEDVILGIEMEPWEGTLINVYDAEKEAYILTLNPPLNYRITKTGKYRITILPVDCN